MEFGVVLVSTSVPVRDAVERVLARTQTPLRHELSAESAMAAATSVSAMICTLEIDWRGLIQSLQACQDVAPPVILLMLEADARLWSDALMNGAFDAISLADGPERLLDTIGKARARWQRARSVRDALKQNAALGQVG